MFYEFGKWRAMNSPELPEHEGRMQRPRRDLAAPQNFDLTGFLLSPRVTGIERVVQEILLHSAEFELAYFRYSDEHATFLELESAPVLERRTGGSYSRRLRFLLREMAVWLWSQSSRVRGKIDLVQRITPVARTFYVRFLSSDIRRPERTRETKVLRILDHICLIDVPRDRNHLLFLLSSAAQGTKFVVYLYDIIPAKNGEEWSSDLQPEQKELFALYLELVLQAEKVVCLSEFSKNEYLSFRQECGLPAQNVKVCLPPIKLGWVAAGKSLPKSLEPRQENRKILAVAPLLRRKNLRVVFAAIQRLIRNGSSPIELNLVCPVSASIDPEALRLLRELKALNSVRVTQHRDITDSKLKSLYQESHLVVVPSLYEGFGLPIVEARAAGCCVIASDIPVFRELSLEIGLRLVDAHAVGNWAREISKCIEGRCLTNSELMSLPSVGDFLDELDIG